ncbi:uncharacterized protein ISCGN_032944, partial [Ixodes scapularis]
MRSLQNPFCFILQILAFLGTGLPPPRQPATISAPSSCTVFLAAIGDDIAPVFDATVSSLPFTKPASSSTTAGFSANLSAWSPQDAFSGHRGAAAMRSLQNPFCFILQILAFLGTGLPPPRQPATISAPSSCTVFLAAIGDDIAPVFDATVSSLPFTKPASSSTTAGFSANLSAWSPQDAFSGHRGAAAMRSLQNPFCFILQVRKYPSFHVKRSCNGFLLLLQCPLVFLRIAYMCVHVFKLLLLSGDVELNPGPITNADILAAIAEQSSKNDARHTEMVDMLNQVKDNQHQLELKVLDINSRLAAVESLVELLDVPKHPTELSNVVSEAVRGETTVLNSRLNELEDRSRRDNLLFYGIADTLSEDWLQSESHIRDNLSTILGLDLPGEAISRAHRLGSYSTNKCRPIIVKFSSSKFKANVFSQRFKLKGTGISVSEDFCPATRQLRKKLIDFGKGTGQRFSLKLNRLHVNQKVYTYCPVTDCVCEVTP